MSGMFEQEQRFHKVERDLKQAAGTMLKPMTKGEAYVMKRWRMILLVILLLIVGWLCFLLGVFDSGAAA